MNPRVLIVAGSDSGGGAGIQADIKTVTMLGGHAMTAITAITAQNSLGVTGVMPVPAEFVIAQIDAVLSDLGADVVKIGMIGSPGVAEAVAGRLEGERVPIVFDPVMVATSGSVLADDATIAAFGRLTAIAALITPNAPELAVLTGRPVRDLAELESAARALAEASGAAVLAKGGHLAGERLTDVLIAPGGEAWRWQDERIDSPHTHGTGCTLASAVATGLAAGLPLRQAVERGRLLVRMALREAPGLGAGHGPMGHQRVRLDLPSRAGPTLNQVTLPAGDYEASVAFYRLLGCRQIVASPPRYARFEAPGGVTLSIEVRETADPPSTTEHFFQCADVDAQVARLAGAGVEFDLMPEDRDYLWRVAETRDPHGNRIRLYQTGEYRRFPPWRID
ncbi:MAG TPA: bifunctional hydroxymethylpyrimidine kinase/phosphomethylpyrimidine kinase [Allosphingosinicella sp.]